MSGPAPWIAVVGPGEASAEEVRRAERVGAEVAGVGAMLVCGGLQGVMAAACRGASRHGGLTVGLLPGDDRRAANPWVRVAVATGLGEGRNLLVVRAADAVVAVGGGWGTLSEIALALKLGRPVVGLDTWMPQRAGESNEGVTAAATPSEAVRRALELVGPGGHG